MTDFSNSYQDEFRAQEYNKLEFHNDYYLAFRDLPEIFIKHVKGTMAIDFGCGTGRSTRFLEKIGFQTIGIDISAEMIAIARKNDEKGHYLLLKDEEYRPLEKHGYHLILSAFTFDNIPQEKKVPVLKNLLLLLQPEGVFINLVSSPEMYTHEWASFSTKDFPENKTAKEGDIVPIITKDFEDRRPCYDIFCTPEAYRRIFDQVGLEVIDVVKPLATGEEPYQWTVETTIAPWMIYITKIQ